MGHEVIISGVSPLELVMQEVFRGMEELALDFAYNSSPGTFEILSIEAPEPMAPPTAQIIRHPRFERRRAASG